jgi:hypothetical protein
MTGAERGLDRGGTPAPTTPGWVAAAGGGTALGARPVRWGFRHETWIVETIDGRVLVVQRRVDRSDPTEPCFRAFRQAVRAAGLPVPEPTRVALAGDEVVGALPFVEGVVAAELLGTDGDPELVGRLCGEVAARLGAMRPAGLPLSRTWASGDHLWAAGPRWLESLPAAAPRTATLPRSTCSCATVGWPPFSISTGRASLTRSTTRPGVAWVVSFHHADVAEAAWSAYARAAGVAIRSPAALAWLWPLQLVERLAEAPCDGERTMWADRLASAIAHARGASATMATPRRPRARQMPEHTRGDSALNRPRQLLRSLAAKRRARHGSTSTLQPRNPGV